MIALGTSTGGQFGDFKKQQDFIMTSSAAGISKDKRSDPLMFSAYWTPAPNAYEVAKAGS